MNNQDYDLELADERQLYSILVHFASILELDEDETDKIWRSYESLFQEKQGIWYGRRRVFLCAGRIKYPLRNLIQKKSKGIHVMRKLAEAFHYFMDCVCGVDRPSSYEWV